MAPDTVEVTRWIQNDEGFPLKRVAVAVGAMIAGGAFSTTFIAPASRLVVALIWIVPGSLLIVLSILMWKYKSSVDRIGVGPHGVVFERRRRQEAVLWSDLRLSPFNHALKSERVLFDIRHVAPDGEPVWRGKAIPCALAKELLGDPLAPKWSLPQDLKPHDSS